MEQYKYILQIWILACVSLLYEAKANQLQTSIRVHKGYTELRWTISGTATSYKVFYQVIGTKFHSIIDLPSSTDVVNITTSDYPGSLYMVRLYAINNGSTDTKLLSTKMFRSGCSDHFNAVVGKTYIIQSPGYPVGYHGGVVCQWTFTGAMNVWYKISMNDFDLPSSQDCSSFLHLIGHRKYCEKTIAQKSEVVSQNTLLFRFNGRSSGKGFNASITAIPVLTAPLNVTATSNGQYIHVNWTLPSYSVENTTFVLNYKAPSSGNGTNIELSNDTTHFNIDATSNQGQIFSLYMYTKTSYWRSNGTEIINIRSGCQYEVNLQDHQEVMLMSPQYPTGILPEVKCQWFFTTSDNFFLKFIINDFHLIDHFDVRCTDTFLDIPGLGKFCNAFKSKDLLVTERTSNVTLNTGRHVKGRGFNITVKSVARPTNPPGKVSISLNTSHIKLHWEPPQDRPNEIIGYIVLYDVMPDIANQELRTKNTFAYIATSGNSGRMFIIKIAAETEGGRSHYTQLKYVRADCGTTHILNHRQSMMIFSPSSKGSYQSGVVCKWKIGTRNDMFLKITIDRLEIESSQLCTKDYLQISNHNRLCGYKHNKEILVKSNITDILFLTDYVNQLNGFIITITAVAPPPGKPEDFQVVASHNALILSWKPPLHLQNYITGYIIYYRFVSHNNFTTEHIPTRFQYYAINTVNTQGLLYEVYMRANGESEPGPETIRVIKRSHCGYYVQNFTQPVFISSPLYPYGSKPGTKCIWRLTTDTDLYVTILDLKLSSSNGSINSSTSSRDYFTISGISDFNSTSLLSQPMVIKDRHIWITYQTFKTSVDGGFLLQVFSKRADNVSALASSPSASSAMSLYSSSASLLYMASSTYTTSSVVGSAFKYPTAASLKPSVSRRLNTTLASTTTLKYNPAKSVSEHTSSTNQPMFSMRVMSAVPAKYTLSGTDLFASVDFNSNSVYMQTSMWNSYIQKRINFTELNLSATAHFKSVVDLHTLSEYTQSTISISDVQHHLHHNMLSREYDSNVSSNSFNDILVYPSFSMTISDFSDFSSSQTLLEMKSFTDMKISNSVIINTTRSTLIDHVGVNTSNFSTKFSVTGISKEKNIAMMLNSSVPLSDSDMDSNLISTFRAYEFLTISYQLSQDSGALGNLRNGTSHIGWILDSTRSVSKSDSMNMKNTVQNNTILVPSLTEFQDLKSYKGNFIQWFESARNSEQTLVSTNSFITDNKHPSLETQPYSKMQFHDGYVPDIHPTRTIHEYSSSGMEGYSTVESSNHFPYLQASSVEIEVNRVISQISDIEASSEYDKRIVSHMDKAFSLGDNHRIRSEFSMTYPSTFSSPSYKDITNLHVTYITSSPQKHDVSSYFVSATGIAIKNSYSSRYSEDVPNDGRGHHTITIENVYVTTLCILLFYI